MCICTCTIIFKIHIKINHKIYNNAFSVDTVDINLVHVHTLVKIINEYLLQLYSKIFNHAHSFL